MSILIKGMKMPDSCYHCKIAESCGHYIANYTNRRHPDCPLIALPNKHGRLVDADEMLKRLQAWNTSDRMDKALYNFAWDRIMEQPTIVESEDSE